jgi:hypothetical protein
MRRGDVNLADVTAIGFLLVAATVAATFAFGLLIVVFLPHEWVRRVPEAARDASVAALAVPVATVGVAVFGFGGVLLVAAGGHPTRRVPTSRRAERTAYPSDGNRGERAADGSS